MPQLLGNALGQPSVYPSQRFEGSRGEAQVARWDERLTQVDADQRGPWRGCAIFAKRTHGGNGRARAAFDDNHWARMRGRQPVIEPPLLGERAGSVPYPVAKHED